LLCHLSRYLCWIFSLIRLRALQLNFPFTVCPGGTNSLCRMPSVANFLECFNYSYICIWPRELSPNASLSILCVSEAILLSLKQNLMQICCSFTSVILAVSTITKQHLHDITKMQRKKHARRHSRTPLGKVVYKGSSLQYLMAHNCTTSGFHVTFQFQGLLCSTSCLTTCNVFLCLIDWQ